MSEGRFSVLKSSRKSDRTTLINDVDHQDVDLTTSPSTSASTSANHYGAVSNVDAGKQPRKSGNVVTLQRAALKARSDCINAVG